MTADKSTLPEAPSSVTYSVERKGFNILFTVRASSGAELLEQMEVIEEHLLDKGYSPQKPKFSGGSSNYAKKEVVYLDGVKCPDCGERVVEQMTKDGKMAYKCATQKWDFKTKTSTGCKFFTWTKPAVRQEAQGSDPAYADDMF